MGIWSGIKHALNSTLGTEEFQPLDQIIKGQKILIANDNVIAVISNSLVNGNAIYPTIFTPKINGVIRILVKGFSTDRNNSSQYIMIFENGIRKYNYLLPNQSSGVSEGSIDIPVIAGSAYSFQQSGYAYVYSIYIGAYVIDGNVFEVNSTN